MSKLFKNGEESDFESMEEMSRGEEAFSFCSEMTKVLNFPDPGTWLPSYLRFGQSLQLVSNLGKKLKPLQALVYTCLAIFSKYCDSLSL